MRYFFGQINCHLQTKIRSTDIFIFITPLAESYVVIGLIT